MNKTIFTAMILAGGLIWAAGSAHAQSEGPQSGPRHPMLRQFLRNHPQLRQRLFERFDANRDGKLDQQERGAVREKLRNRGHSMRGFQQGRRGQPWMRGQHFRRGMGFAGPRGGRFGQRGFAGPMMRPHRPMRGNAFGGMQRGPIRGQRFDARRGPGRHDGDFGGMRDRGERRGQPDAMRFGPQRGPDQHDFDGPPLRPRQDGFEEMRDPQPSRNGPPMREPRFNGEEGQRSNAPPRAPAPPPPSRSMNQGGDDL